MKWNWQLANWPKFRYDPDLIAHKERRFLFELGKSCAFLKSLEQKDYHQFAVEILSSEGIESSKIEGELLDRGSLQSSIQRHFGLKGKKKSRVDKESGMAHLLCNVYDSFDAPLTHEMLWQWHAHLFSDSVHLESGYYRTHSEPMQIVSHRYDTQRVFFEAPPSSQLLDEMTTYIDWFNTQRVSEPILGRAAFAHVYFESIHPFEDGNGRIGRILIEKVLSQGIGRPVLMAVSKVLESRKKEYYAALEKCNRTLVIDHWVDFFSDVVLQAQEESKVFLQFLLDKTKILSSLEGKMNARQEKVLLRMFAEGPSGFKGGLSAENYIAITKASRATTTRDLMDLVREGVLVKTGELRHTRYWLNIRS